MASIKENVAYGTSLREQIQTEDNEAYIKTNHELIQSVINQAYGTADHERVQMKSNKVYEGTLITKQNEAYVSVDQGRSCQMRNNQAYMFRPTLRTEYILHSLQLLLCHSLTSRYHLVMIQHLHSSCSSKAISVREMMNLRLHNTIA